MRGNIRIIPRLDIKGPNVVKGVHLEGLRVIGKPEFFASKYYADGADELIYIDSVASLYGRNSIEEIVRRTAREIFIPLTVGGGIRSVQEIEKLLRVGADKVAINTAAIKNPLLIDEGVRTFGAQCVVVSIHAKYRGEGRYECLTDNARETTGLDVTEWAKKVADLGAGELLITSVDRDGTGKGYDLELIRKISELVDIPVIASGGAGEGEHVKQAIFLGKADAICAASIFHYALLDSMRQMNAEWEEGNVEFLSKRLPILSDGRKGITPTTIVDLKKYLEEAGIHCAARRTEAFSAYQ